MIVLNTTDNKSTLVNQQLSLDGLTNGFPSKRMHHSMVYLSEGVMLVQGGIDSKNQTLSDLWTIRFDSNGIKV